MKNLLRLLCLAALVVFSPLSRAQSEVPAPTFSPLYVKGQLDAAYTLLLKGVPQDITLVQAQSRADFYRAAVGTEKMHANMVRAISPVSVDFFLGRASMFQRAADLFDAIARNLATPAPQG